MSPANLLDNAMQTDLCGFFSASFAAWLGSGKVYKKFQPPQALAYTALQSQKPFERICPTRRWRKILLSPSFLCWNPVPEVFTSFGNIPAEEKGSKD